MFYALDQGGIIYRYSLATAWDLTTATYVNSYNSSAQEGTARGMTFKPDYTEFYVTGTANDKVSRYLLH